MRKKCKKQTKIDNLTKKDWKCNKKIKQKLYPKIGKNLSKNTVKLVIYIN